MTCDDARRLMPAYVDGELDVSAGLDFEEHLSVCPGCLVAYRSQQALREGMAAAALYYTAPAALRTRITTAVRREDRAAAPARRVSWAWLGAPAALLLLAIVAWALVRGRQASQNNLLAQEVLSSSMRSLIAGPLTDVASSDQHTVKPWFAGKLDFSPVVQDFAVQGFPLDGGRLDYVGGRPVAALVYRHQQHVINLYTWPVQAPAGQAPAVTTMEGPPQEASYQGYNVFDWTQGGMAYWAVSDMDAAELRQFVQLVQGLQTQR